MIWAAMFAFDLLVALHAYRTGRPQYWPFIIMIFPGLGAFAYFVFEIMPELIGPNSPRAIRARATRKVNAVDALQAAEKELAMVDTAANQVAVGDAHFAMGAFQSAADHYRIGLDRVNGSDARIEMKLAQALFEAGQFARALTIVDRQTPPVAIGEADRLAFLRARILGELGRADEALAIYADITTRVPGEEARCRYAALLLETGKRDQAQAVLHDVHKGLAKLRKEDRAEHAAMFEWAEQQYSALRS
jgi:hypothetical protein